MTENELIEKYNAFIKPERGIQNTLMVFGFECDKGWFPILERLFEALSKLDKPEGFEITQVKEKYGSLIVYTNYSTDEIDDLIEKAEAESLITCELCGQAGSMTKYGGWYRVLCNCCCIEAGHELNKMGEREVL